MLLLKERKLMIALLSLPFRCEIKSRKMMKYLIGSEKILLPSQIKLMIALLSLLILFLFECGKMMKNVIGSEKNFIS